MVRRIAFVVVVVAVALVLGLAGCQEASEKTGLGAASQAMLAATYAPSDIVTLADVEQITGLSDLTVVSYDPAAGYTGDVNVVDATGAAVVMLVGGDAESWDAWLTDGYTVSQPITPPVGDESIVGPNPDVAPVLSIFAFRKGERAVLLETTLGADGQPRLANEQLIELAELIEPRL